jgi:hypothetical protein
MKPIELSKEQQGKLLEMCKALFPEYEFELEIEPQYDGSDGFIYVADIKLLHLGNYIHWFEFCMTHLIREICILRTNDDLGFCPEEFDALHKKSLTKCLMYDNPKHPVDYLYEEFKKLRNE